MDAKVRWLFVSDVDGTLIGDDDAINNINEKLKTARNNLIVAYNSGRSCASLLKTFNEKPKLPIPDFLIGSMGTEIEKGIDKYNSKNIMNNKYIQDKIYSQSSEVDTNEIWDGIRKKRNGKRRFFMFFFIGVLGLTTLMWIFLSGNIIEGMESKWKMTRNIEGTFSLEVKATLNGENIEGTENGNWWVENGLFHEYHDVSGGTDIYHYEVLNKKQIKFKVKRMSIALVNENYEFIDTKMTE